MVSVYRLSSATRIYLKLMLCLAATGLSPACQIATIDKPSDTPAAKITQRGRVINSITGEPVPFALVYLPGMKPLRAMLTGSDGSFEFANVPAMLKISAKKPGFLGKGGTREGLSGTTVQIPSGGEPVTLALVPEAVIAGHITDARGEPMEGVRIKVYHSRIERGRRSWQGVAEDITDDEGNFRAADLEPGRYYIAVQPDNARTQLLRAFQPKRFRRGYRAIVYYPDNRDDISALEIAAGQHIDVPISLSEEPLFEVSGRIAGGTAEEEMKVNVVNDRGEKILSDSTSDSTIEADGAFTIRGLGAGTYTMSFGFMKSMTEIWLAQTTIHVERDMKGLQLRLFRTTSIPIKLTGEVTNQESVWHERAWRRYDLQASVWPVGEGNEAGRAKAQLAYHENSLVLVALTPGTYSVQFTTPVGYIASATCGSTDLLRENLVIPAGTAMPPIEVVLRSDTGTLTGSTPGWDWTTLVVASDIPNIPPEVSQVGGHSTFPWLWPRGVTKSMPFLRRKKLSTQTLRCWNIMRPRRRRSALLRAALPT